MERKNDKDLEKMANSPYAKNLMKIADDVHKLAKDNDQGYIIATMTHGDKKPLNFLSFSLPKDNYVSFWTTIATTIEKVKETVKEDDLPQFRAGFLAAMNIVIEKCFPTLYMNTDFDAEEGDKNEN